MLLDTPICDFSQKISDFELCDFAGKKYNLEENFSKSDKKALLVMFICNHCPYVKAIIERLVADVKELQEIGVEIVSIMSNDYKSYPDDAPDKMAEFAAANAFTFPYLVDEDQEVARKFGAVCTPDFFGFNKDGMLRYRGRIDDLAMKGTANTKRKRELFEAMKLIAENDGKPQGQRPSMGCSIKWR